MFLISLHIFLILVILNFKVFILLQLLDKIVL